MAELSVAGDIWAVYVSHQHQRERDLHRLKRYLSTRDRRSLQWKDDLRELHDAQNRHVHDSQKLVELMEIIDPVM
jgi:hypothetical protein